MGKSSTTTSTSGPPAQFLQAYSDVYNRAQGVAGQPLQQYPAGPNASNIVAPLQPNQNQAISDIAGIQGQYQPYINQAQTYMNRAATPITPLQFQGVENLPSAGLAGFQTAAMGAPQNFASNIGTYENPYTQQVTRATQDLMNQQNATQFGQIRGNAAAQGAFGGDREAAAEALTAGQQQLAEAPTLAGIQQQGYQQAIAELNAQQQMGLARGQGLLGEFNTQQQAGTQAQEATGWLNQGAGYGTAQLGNEWQNLGLAGAQALMGAGGVQQGQAQQVLNVPYEQFIQQQAYPFQTTGWLANIAEGLGGSSGGTSSTTYPGPSALSQIGGLAAAGTGIIGATGGFGSNGWLTGGGTSSLGAFGSNPLTDIPGDFGGFGYKEGGRITNDATPRFAFGGAPPTGSGVPDLALSIVPGASGMGDRPSSGGGPMHSAFMQPVTTQTQSGGGGGILGLVGPALSIGKLFLADGGEAEPVATPLQSPADMLDAKLKRLEHLHSENFGPETILGSGNSFRRITEKGAGNFDDGGVVFNGATPGNKGILSVPDVSKGYVPAMLQAPNGRMGPPAPPAAPPQNQSDPLAQGLAILKDTKSFKNLFGDNSQSESLGGAVEPSATPLQFDDGGPVPPQVMMGGAGNPALQRQSQVSLVQQYSQLPIEKLREMALRFPPNSAPGMAVQRAIQMKQMTGSTGYPGGQTPSGPTGPAGEAVPGTTAARGGRMRAEGGDSGDEEDTIEPRGLSTPAPDASTPPSGVPLSPDTPDTLVPGGALQSPPPAAPAGGSVALPLSSFGPDDATPPTPPRPAPEAAPSGSPPASSTDDEAAYQAGLAGFRRNEAHPGDNYAPDVKPESPEQYKARMNDEEAPASTPASPGLASPPAASSGRPEAGAGWDWPSAWAAIKHFESRNLDIPNYRYDSGHTASGYGQITDTNWHIWAPKLGIDIKQFPHAMGAPEPFQEAVGHAMFNADKERGGTGFGDWAPFNPKLAAFIGGGGSGAKFTGGDRIAGPGEAITPASLGQASATSSGGLGDISQLVSSARTPREKTFLDSPWMPLIAVGAGMLASRSPFPGVALGEGLETGLKVAGQQEERGNKAELADVRLQSAENQAKNMAARIDEIKSHHEALETEKGNELQVRQQLADAATARAQTARANAASMAEARQIQNDLKKQLADIKSGAGTWTYGPGPDPGHPGATTPGMWHSPTTPDPNDPHGGIKFYPGQGAPKQSNATALFDRKLEIGHQLYPGNEQAASDFAMGHKMPTPQEYARSVQITEGQLRAQWTKQNETNPDARPPNFRVLAEAEVKAMLGNAPGVTAPATPAASPAAPAPHQGNAAPAQPTAPPWATSIVRGPNGVVLYRDATGGLFNPQHQPYQPAPAP